MMHYSNRNNFNRSGAAAPVGQVNTPYNFVSLPKKAVLSPLNKNLPEGGATQNSDEVTAAVRQYLTDNVTNGDSYTGEIRLTITTETPCFICAEQKSDPLPFFAPTGEVRLPGSSIRGMVKNLFKIITCSAFRPQDNENPDGDFGSRHLYFRSMADKYKPFRQYYQKEMGLTMKNSVAVTQPGFIVSDNAGGGFFIIPALNQEPRPKLYGRQGQDDAPYVEWNAAACDCFTAKMNGKKHYQTIYYPDWRTAKRLPLAAETVADYRADHKRGNVNSTDTDNSKAAEWNLFDGKNLCLKNDEAREITKGQFSFVAPCFFRAENDEVIDFGFGHIYRIRYQKSIADHVPAALQTNAVDFTDAVFGRKEFWAGRVSFADATVVQKSGFLSPERSRPLMTPNPTSFQLYLNKNADNPAHWDDNTAIRGYKLYWHKKCGDNDWRIRPADKEISGTRAITPLRAGSVFSGKIRFRELTQTELGALLKVFDLAREKDTIRYKIGQGKSLGMGTVKIDSRLFVLTPDRAYGELFADKGWRDPLMEDEALYRAAVKKFDDFMLAECNKLDIVNDYRRIMQDLRLLLDASHADKIKNWKNKTDYMELTDFKNRVPLPLPQEIVT